MNLTVIKPHRIEFPVDFPYKSFDDLPLYDHRYMPRWLTASRVFYRKDGGHVLARSLTRDITPEGASVYTDGTLHARDRLELKVYLSPHHNFQTKGTVLWQNQVHNREIAGVRFDPLPQEIQDLIVEHGFITRAIIEETCRLNEESARETLVS